MTEYKTVNVQKNTHKKLQKLKIEKEYNSLNTLIEEEIDFTEVE